MRATGTDVYTGPVGQRRRGLDLPLPQMTVRSAEDALAAQAERSAARVSKVHRK